MAQTDIIADALGREIAAKARRAYVAVMFNAPAVAAIAASAAWKRAVGPRRMEEEGWRPQILARYCATTAAPAPG